MKKITLLFSVILFMICACGSDKTPATQVPDAATTDTQDPIQDASVDAGNPDASACRQE